ncbi:hypothetical protein [Saccharothrix sp. HUAS TT1]|uniref:hypothetical protein n=1 Tax=unclassified Saccharothrix TaxID=2593673 RepID=UPI00345BA8AF
MSGPGVHPGTGLPTWRGRIVPHVTAWSGEQVDPITRPFGYVTRDDGREYLTYEHAEVSGLAAGSPLLEQRDLFGLLWFSGHDRPGVGEPQFAIVHAQRQRDCMIGRRCQVCGTPFPRGGPVTFLVPEHVVPEDGRPFETAHPPVCGPCRPYALVQCPHLRQVPFAWVVARAYRPTGVLADLYVPDRGTGGIDEETGVVLPLGHVLLRYAVTKQLRVTVRSYTVEPAAPHRADRGPGRR